MFTPIGSIEDAITVFLDGMPLIARDGESVAACLLRAGIPHFRTTPVTAAPRLPFCMIGHCFECLIEIDGVGNRQACLALVREGMQLRVQRGAADIPHVPSS